MEGFLNLKWPRWKRVLLTRTIAIAPTLAVTLTSTIQKLTGMNDYLNAVLLIRLSQYEHASLICILSFPIIQLMVIQLPFAILPTLTFSSSQLVMGRFVNNRFNRFVATALSVAVVLINIYFVIQTLMGIESDFIILIYVVAAIYGIFYFIFVLYLVGGLGCFRNLVTKFAFSP